MASPIIIIDLTTEEPKSPQYIDLTQDDDEEMVDVSEPLQVSPLQVSPPLQMEVKPRRSARLAKKNEFLFLINNLFKL